MIAFRDLVRPACRLEKLYLKDEIRLDNNIGNTSGAGPGFSVYLEEYSDSRSGRLHRPHPSTTVLQN